MGAVMHTAVGVAMVMMAASLGNHLRRHRQAGRGVVFGPFSDVADQYAKECNKEQNEK